MTKCIMVQGTSSNAGKSVLVAALCRIYSRRGYKVAPFKSQNMSLNSYTTKENGEIAIAQVLQAEAAEIEPSVHMNPILLKPKGDFTSQVIIQGKTIGNMNFYDYQHDFRETALKAIEDSLNILKEEYDIIFIEGAGSPAEINMRKEDLANMEIAHMSNADVLLVADIDKGGVFASIAGTFSLLDDYDRDRLKAVIINKFRGNLDILTPGVKKIEKIINAPVLGVIPYDNSLKLPEEDSASLYEHEFETNKEIMIGVIRLPKIANFTDIHPFEFEEDVGLKLIDIDDEIGNVDAIIIPGTRKPIEDLESLKKTGMDEKIRKLASDISIVGISGGYQMLAEKIHEENENTGEKTTVDGLKLLKMETLFKKGCDEDKIVKQSSGTIVKPKLSKANLNTSRNKDLGSSNSNLNSTPNEDPKVSNSNLNSQHDKNLKISNSNLNSQPNKNLKVSNSNLNSQPNLLNCLFSSIKEEEINGYEIHEGVTKLTGSQPLLKIKNSVGNSKSSEYNGAIEGNVFGSYFHGIFHNYKFRNGFLNYLREKKGLEPRFDEDPYEAKKDYSIEKLAKIVEDNVDMEFIDNLIIEKNNKKI